MTKKEFVRYLNAYKREIFKLEKLLIRKQEHRPIKKVRIANYNGDDFFTTVSFGITTAKDHNTGITIFLHGKGDFVSCFGCNSYTLSISDSIEVADVRFAEFIRDVDSILNHYGENNK